LELDYTKEWDIEDLLIRLNLLSQMYWFCETVEEKERIYRNILQIKQEFRHRGWELDIPASTERIET